MKERRSDFYFVGLAVVPVMLVLGDLHGLALLVFFPLLLAGCIAGMDEQVRDEIEKEKRSAAGGSTGNRPPREGIAMRERDRNRQD